MSMPFGKPTFSKELLDLFALCSIHGTLPLCSWHCAGCWITMDSKADSIAVFLKVRIQQGMDVKEILTQEDHCPPANRKDAVRGVTGRRERGEISLGEMMAELGPERCEDINKATRREEHSRQRELYVQRPSGGAEGVQGSESCQYGLFPII